jgi:hypothetical protein
VAVALLKPEAAAVCTRSQTDRKKRTEKTSTARRKTKEVVVCSMCKSYKDSLKVLEADIQHANTL